MDKARLSNLIKELVVAYREQKSFLLDPLRSAARIEIPAAFALSALRFDLKEHGDFAEKLCNIIVDNQNPVGFWLEYPYSEKAQMRGFAGAIPTSFAIFALLEGYKKFRNEKYLDSARQASEWLYQNEKNGYFLKASLNKSDVINTNLMAALALFRVSEALPEHNQAVRLYRFAAARALRRSIASQFFSGAFPYISFGFGVPFLYQAMTTALVGIFSDALGLGILKYSFAKGTRHLNRILDQNGRFLWQRTRAKDKEGAIWAYGWAALCFALSGNKRRFEEMFRRLVEAKQKHFLQSGDFDNREDLFYTSWTLLSLSLADLKPVDRRGISFSDKARFCFLGLTALYPRLVYAIKILFRKLFRLSLDKGPAEEW